MPCNYDITKCFIFVVENIRLFFYQFYNILYMSFLIRLLINAVCVYILANYLPHISVDSFANSVLVAALLAFVNSFLKPILSFITFPITVLTMGLFALVVNAAMVMLVDYLVDGFVVSSWLWAIIFVVLLSILNSVLLGIIDNDY